MISRIYGESRLSVEGEEGEEFLYLKKFSFTGQPPESE
jgi:hypothetical protein